MDFSTQIEFKKYLAIKELNKNLERRNKKNKVEIIPEWRNHLVNKGYLYPDGKRVANSLNDTAVEYTKFTKQKISSQFIKENFLKADYTEYGISACNAARDYANAN